MKTNISKTLKEFVAAYESVEEREALLDAGKVERDAKNQLNTIIAPFFWKTGNFKLDKIPNTGLRNKITLNIISEIFGGLQHLLSNIDKNSLNKLKGLLNKTFEIMEKDLKKGSIPDEPESDDSSDDVPDDE